MDKHKLLLSFMEEDNTSFVRKSVRMNWSLWMLVWIDSVPFSGLPCPRAQPRLLCQELRGSLRQALALRLGSTFEIFPVLLLFVVNFALWILFCSLPTHPDLALCICLGSQIHLPMGADPNTLKPQGHNVTLLFSNFEILVFSKTYSGFQLQQIWE